MTCRKAPSLFYDLAKGIQDYLFGEKVDFSRLIEMPEGTPFYQSVWSALLSIPYGLTLSYGELGALLGKPNASRAVGQANGRNPLPLLIPCHRVVTASGKLGGFSCGLAIKRWLLELEGIRL